MRTMIGKRIGPVPIALVAVLALAAFISAGLWLVPTGTQNAEAQGFADNAQDPKHVCEPMGNNDEADFTADPVTNANTPVDNQCIAFGESATVRLSGEGTYHVVTDGRITGGTNSRFYLPDTVDATGQTTEPTSTISYLEVEVPAANAVSGTKAEADITVARNGKNPITLHVIAQEEDDLNTTLGINPDADPADYEIDNTEADLIETIYFVTTPLGGPTDDKSALMIADVGDTEDVIVDTTKGESGVITATFMDYARVATASNYKNLATAAAVDATTNFGNVQVTSAGILTVVALDDIDHRRLNAALIPGMYVTVTNVHMTNSHTGVAETRVTTPGSVMTSTFTRKILTNAPDDGGIANAIDLTLDGETALTAQSLGATFVADDGQAGTTTSTTSNVTIVVHASRSLEGGTVTFTVEGDGAMLQAGAGLVEGTEVKASAEQAMTADTGLKVIGLPKNTTDPYRVVVKAEYSGPTGTHTLTNDDLKKLGPLATVDATACAVKDDNKDKYDGCGAGYVPMNRYTPMDEAQDFGLHMRAEDALGSWLATGEKGSMTTGVTYSVRGVTAEQWWNSLDCAAMNAAVDPEDDEPAVGSDDETDDPRSPYCYMYDGLSEDATTVVDRAFEAYGDVNAAFDFSQYRPEVDEGRKLERGMTGMAKIKADPPAGKYALIVTAVKGDVTLYSDILKVVISGKAASYDITMKDSDDALPEIDEIELNGSRTYILTITDSNGNIPNDIGDLEVKIVLHGGTEFNNLGNFLSVVETPAGYADVDTKTGTVEFNVYGPLDLALDTPARIVVSESGSQKATQRILFKGSRSSVQQPPQNRAPTATGTISDVSMYLGGSPMTVNVMGNFSDADNDALTFSASSSNTAVATVSTDATLGQVTITAVGEGTATITVGATDGTHGVVTTTFMVTVSDSSLGNPSGIGASSDAAGSITVTWTAGSNADNHYVWAYPVGGPQGMWSPTLAGDDSSHTFSGLESGQDYWFIVLASRGSGDAVTYSGYSGWSSAVTVQ